ncbi:MAG TPA: hypothetical protein DCL38_01415 [Lachnospiraceae bacterium]|nr:hypothetical protein [Lachnospiraceae bacterium]
MNNFSPDSTVSQTDNNKMIRTICEQICAGVNRWSAVFIINMVAACAAYSLLLTNQLVNQLDGMWHGSVSYANGHELSNGRWFWRFIDRARQYLSPDPVTSVISVALFTLSVILILDIFEVKSKLASYLASLLFTINVSVLVSLSYRYMSPTFSLSCFLSVLAAYITIKVQKKLPAISLGAICIALMLGLYQANIGVICLIFLLYTSLLLYRETGYKELAFLILRFIAVILAGFILYFILLNINLVYYEVQMSDYNGADSYGPLGALLNLPGSFLHTYGDFINYYRNDGIRSTVFPGKFYVLIYFMLGIHFFIAAVSLFKKSRLRAVLFCLSFCLIPAAANSVLMAAYGSFTSIQMTVPMSLCIPVLIGLASELPLERTRLSLVYRSVTAVLLSLLIYGNYLMTIYDQQAMYMGMKSLKKLSADVTAALQMYNYYHPYYQFVFVGRPSDNPLFVKNFVFEKANEYACMGSWDPEDLRWVVQSWQGFFTHEAGTNLYIADDEKLEEALLDETVRAMPVFPEYGSIAMVNDVVVVKLSDDYSYEEE